MYFRESLILIPAYNEESNISSTLTDLRAMYPDTDILVVNDGSRDATAEKVLKVGEKLLNHPFNLGYGAALQTGFKFAQKYDYMFIVQFDADGQHDPGDVARLLEEIQSGDCDIVIGSRFMGRGGENIGILKKIAINLFRRVIKIFTGDIVTDPTSGLQCLSRRAFCHYAIAGNFPEDFPDADTIIMAKMEGLKIKEIPANIRIRHAGESMHKGLKVVYYMLKMLLSISVVIIREKTKRRT